MGGTIRFKKQDLKDAYGEVHVDGSKSLMGHLLAAGLPVASSCGGEGVCAKCRLHVYEIDRNATTPKKSLEKLLLTKNQAESDERISCLTKVLGTIEVDADYW